MALASAPGNGAIALLRVSGPKALSIIASIAYGKSGVSIKETDLQAGKVRLVEIRGFDMLSHQQEETLLDEVLLTVFKNPRSYTGEDLVELSCHGSVYIQQQLMALLLSKGARMAMPGDFTQRAFLNGKMDLSQAEAVADLIASRSAGAHRIAMQQMRGGFSSELQDLRGKLIKFASLIELELDFSQEDVTFADKDALIALVTALRSHIQILMDSFALGNAIRNGVPVAIVGKPNAGKSTLLNALLNEERAIVSDIPGTTRDTIEEELVLNGVSFRFIDTAGIRGTGDTIENLGIERSFSAMRKATVVIYLFDVVQTSREKLKDELATLNEHLDATTKLILVGNKCDQADAASYITQLEGFEASQATGAPIFISSRDKTGLDRLQASLAALVDMDQLDANSSVVSNARHLDALGKAEEALGRVKRGLDAEISGDLLASDIRQALYYIGSITGVVSVEDLLESIFRDFCIGK